MRMRGEPLMRDARLDDLPQIGAINLAAAPGVALLTGVRQPSSDVPLGHTLGATSSVLTRAIHGDPRLVGRTQVLAWTQVPSESERSAPICSGGIS